jgi:hypothetical protein
MLLKPIINVITFFWMPLSCRPLTFFPDNTKVSCVCVFQFITLLTVIIQLTSMEHRTNDDEKVKYSEKTRPSAWASAGRGQRLTPSAMVRPAEHAKLNFEALY